MWSMVACCDPVLMTRILFNMQTCTRDLLDDNASLQHSRRHGCMENVIPAELQDGQTLHNNDMVLFEGKRFPVGPYTTHHSVDAQ